MLLAVWEDGVLHYVYSSVLRTGWCVMYRVVCYVQSGVVSCVQSVIRMYRVL